MALTDVLDLSGMRLRSGDGRQLELEVELEPVELAGETYAADPARVPVRVDVSRTNGGGYALRLRFAAALRGPCMRCLGEAMPLVSVDAREVELRGGGEELDSPYVDGELVDLRAWARDAFVLAAPDQIVCDPDCPGLCPTCAQPLRELGPDHRHDEPPDPRWAKLAEFRFD